MQRLPRHRGHQARPRRQEPLKIKRLPQQQEHLEEANPSIQQVEGPEREITHKKAPLGPPRRLPPERVNDPEQRKRELQRYHVIECCGETKKTTEKVDQV